LAWLIKGAIAAAPSPPIPRITGKCGFCLVWVETIAQRTLKELCGWWHYIGFGGAISFVVEDIDLEI
jgi:hypothetical protein